MRSNRVVLHETGGAMKKKNEEEKLKEFVKVFNDLMPDHLHIGLVPTKEAL